MNELLKTVLADLRDRRLLPFVALVGVALVGGIAYAMLGGGSSATPTASVPVPLRGASGIAVVQAHPETAVAETTNGTAEQRKGKVHDPFNLLPAAAKAAASVASSTSTSTSTSTGTSTGSSPSAPSSETPPKSGAGTGSGPVEVETKPTKPSKPSTPKTVYHVAVLFGVVPSGATPFITALTPYQSLKLLTPLPAKQPLLVFRGVTAGGKAATFTLVGEAILHGLAACLPNATQCQAIDLQPKRYEQLEYLTPTGEVITYELRVVSITAKKASAASVHTFLAHQSKAGRELLRSGDLLDIPLLRSSTQPGVFVFAAHPARTARSHTAANRGR
jgi:hypothetical protein